MKNSGRILAGSCCALLLVLSTASVHAAETKQEAAYLEYVGSQVLYSGRSHTWKDDQYTKTVTGVKVPGGELYTDYAVTDDSLHISVWTKNGTILLDEPGSDNSYTDDTYGWASGTISWTIPPERISLWQPDPAHLEWDDVRIDFTGDFQNLYYDWRYGENTDEEVYPHGYYSIDAYCYMGSDILGRDEAIEYRDLSSGDYIWLSANDTGPTASRSETVDLYIPSYISSQNELCVFYVMIRAGGNFYSCADYEIAYIYEYHENDAAAPASAADSDEPEPDMITQTEVTDALSDPGEDGGVEIDPGIIDPSKSRHNDGDTDMAAAAALSIGGALAAAGVLGAAKSGGRKKKKRYKMYVYKAFGDAIAKGAHPVKVYARISQIIDGKEYDCPEQTKKIRASGEGLTVRPAGIEGKYMAAEVSAEPAADVEKGTLIFSLAGPGGIIRRSIVFRLVDEPRIVFPGDSVNGHWDLSVVHDTVQMVSGLGGSERLRFVFIDAVEEPEEIRFLDTDGFDIQPEKDAKLAYTYYAVIQNHTDPADKEGGVFAGVRECCITIEAEFPEHVTVRNSFTIELYPDGLSVLITGGPNPLRPKTPGMRTILKDGHMEIISYATRDKEELTLDPVIPPTDFDPCFAAVTPEGKALIAREPRYFSFGKLESTDNETKNLLAKYHYEVRWHQNGFAFRPGDSVPEMEAKYYLLLPMTASVDTCSGSADIPVRLLGEPFDPMKDWNAEFRGLCETAVRYFPGDVAHGYVQYIREHFSDPDLWDRSELRAMRHEVIRAAQVYWTRQAEYQMRLVAYYDLTEVIFKKPARFIGDTAFKIVVRFYYGENENWITPCKDLIVDTIDEAVWSYAQTGQADWNFTENLLTQSTNTIENYISIADSKGAGLTFSTGNKDTKQLAIALCGFVLAEMIQNYYKMDPKDFFECLRRSFIDLSAMALRKIAGAGLLKAANSQWVQKFFKLSWVKAVTDHLKKNMVQEVARGQATIIDPKTGLSKIQETRITGNVDAKITDGRNFVHFGEVGTQADSFGKVHTTLDAGDLELQHTLLGGPGQEVEVQLVNFDYLESATYREMVQRILDGLFGLGIATLRENLDDDPGSQDYGVVSFPVYTKNGKKTYAVINIYKLLTSPEGLASRAFGMVYDALFGDFSAPSSTEGPKDVGRAVLAFSDIHPE